VVVLGVVLLLSGFLAVVGLLLSAPRDAPGGGGSEAAVDRVQQLLRAPTGREAVAAAVLAGDEARDALLRPQPFRGGPFAGPSSSQYTLDSARDPGTYSFFTGSVPNANVLESTCDLPKTFCPKSSISLVDYERFRQGLPDRDPEHKRTSPMPFFFVELLRDQLGWVVHCDKDPARAPSVNWYQDKKDFVILPPQATRAERAAMARCPKSIGHVPCSMGLEGICFKDQLAVMLHRLRGRARRDLVLSAAGVESLCVNGAPGCEQEPDFIPPTFILSEPSEVLELHKQVTGCDAIVKWRAERAAGRPPGAEDADTWLVKTRAHHSSGITILNDHEELRTFITGRTDPCGSEPSHGQQERVKGSLRRAVVQKYMPKPLLWDGRKLNVRAIFVVPSFATMDVYMYNQPYVMRAMMSHEDLEQAEQDKGSELEGDPNGPSSEQSGQQMLSRAKYLTNLSLQELIKDKIGDKTGRRREDELNGPDDYGLSLEQLELYLVQQGRQAHGLAQELRRKMQQIGAIVFASVKDAAQRLQGAYGIYAGDFLIADDLSLYLLEVTKRPQSKSFVYFPQGNCGEDLPPEQRDQRHPQDVWRCHLGTEFARGTIRLLLEHHGWLDDAGVIPTAPEGGQDLFVRIV